ncbi:MULTISPECIES: GNAT family N-acetyltransferase [Methylobacterium]|uniref:GNAT family N-acetyltransferase n=1 Tax=Methylobacterium TaxID=407 RepID=UPI0013EA7CA6|nr:GNAT family N-acetyltransferase [Methylobacterium sp. DB0501]NGM38206.1 GNAT family N-acetyltransferase [Methylobacterium sp. DB0501]
MSRPIAIRRSGPDDGAAVTALPAATYPILMAPAYETATLSRALPLMVRANPVLLASGSFHVAGVPGQIVGCGGWTPERPGTGEVEPGLGHIRHFAVHPASGGCGIGRALFEACREQARARGVEAFECYASLNAEPFYRALGFTKLAPRDIAMGDGVQFPAVWMQCRL